MLKCFYLMKILVKVLGLSFFSGSEIAFLISFNNSYRHTLVNVRD